MAVAWQERQRRLVQEELHNHPIESGQCAALARRLLPLAQEIDVEAHNLLLTPKVGRFLPLRQGQRRWLYHATTAITAHRVDALTGEDGYPTDNYLANYFLYPDVIQESISTLEESWL